MRRVLLCGKSLLISGLEASLMTAPGLELQNVDTRPEQIRIQIRAWQPNVMIIESRFFQSALAVELLHEFPSLKLIGLDIEDNRLQVFSGQSSQAPTPEKLLQMIEEK